MSELTLTKDVLVQHTEDAATKAVESVKAEFIQKFDDQIKAVEKLQSVVDKLDAQRKAVLLHGSTEKAAKLQKDIDIAQYMKNVLENKKGLELWDNVASYKLVHTSQPTGNPATETGTFNTVFPEFVAQIFEDMCRENALRQWLSQRTTQSQLINIQTEVLDMVAAHVDECAIKPVTDTKIERIELRISKVAAVVLACDELLADTNATDFTGFLSRKLADAFRRLENKDILLADGAGFQGTSALWYGVLNATDANGFTQANGWKNGGIKEIIIGSGTQSIGDITMNDLINAVYGLETCAVNSNTAWYMERRTFLAIARLEDNNGQYRIVDERSGVEPLLLGFPVRFVDEMPAPTLDASFAFGSDPDTPFILFGDLRNTLMAMRQGLTFSTSQEATVDDGGTTYLLWQQNMTAIRAETRYGLQHLKPSAYAVIKTAPL